MAFIVYKASLPRPVEAPPAPTFKFGTLPKPIFPQSITQTQNYTFTLDTDTGNLPKNIPTIAKVYVVPQLGATFLAADRVKQLAEKFGFTIGPEILTSSTHRFSDPTGGVMTINLETGNFYFERAEAYPSAETQNLIIDDQTKIAQEFKSFLSSKGLLKKDLQNGRAQVKYNTLTQKESSHASISMWPNKLDELEIVTPKFYAGLVNADLSKFGKDEEKYIQLNYVYWEPDQTNFSTYAIKSPQTAFEELKNNQGVIVADAKNPAVSITSVRLAYYEPEEYPTYLQPIYVFEGPDFIAYVPAITSDYLSK